MSVSALEQALVKRMINPLMVALIERGLGPPTYALVETIGRRTGRRRLVPVANGLDGDTFWLIAALGDQAAYARKIRANPKVRVRARPSACVTDCARNGGQVPPTRYLTTTPAHAITGSAAAGPATGSTAS